MPLYEYRCGSCGAEFELLISASETPRCAQCDSPEVEKQFSVFAVGGTGQSAARDNLPEACRSCGDPRGPGACGLG